MTCSNWMLSILAVVVFIFALWPGIAGVTVTKWIVGIAAVLILIISWTGVECKMCKKKPNTKAKRK